MKDLFITVTYHGKRGKAALDRPGEASADAASSIRVVLVEKSGADIQPLAHVVQHAPAGYDWGGALQGAARDLAISILADFLGDNEALARKEPTFSELLYLEFFQDVIPTLDATEFWLAGTRIADWLACQGLVFNGRTWRVTPRSRLSDLLLEDANRGRSCRPLYRYMIEDPGRVVGQTQHFGG